MPSIPLCEHHLLVAHDWVAREVGVTDRLPSPCLACGSRLGVRYPSGWLCAICEWKVGDIPDAAPGAVRVDVVYYLRYRDRVKIGTSGNPRGRFAALLHEEVLAFERGDRELEQRRHAQFAAQRIPRTEWFEQSGSSRRTSPPCRTASPIRGSATLAGSARSWRAGAECQASAARSRNATMFIRLPQRTPQKRFDPLRERSTRIPSQSKASHARSRWVSPVRMTSTSAIATSTSMRCASGAESGVEWMCQSNGSWITSWGGRPFRAAWR